MDIGELGPEDILVPEALAEYKRGMGLFQEELTRLNADLYIVEKMSEFPLDLFTELGKRDFFNLVVYNSVQAAVLIITRLATDQRRGCFTLKRFPEQIRGWMKDEYKGAFDARLHTARFDGLTDRLARTAKTIRNKRLAHLIVDQERFELPPGTSLTLSELKRLRDSLVSLFDALAFGCQHHTWVLQYSPLVIHPRGVDTRSDVEQVLDSVAKDSVLFNLPETHPAGWPFSRQALGQEGIENFNRYRRKLGFPEI